MAAIPQQLNQPGRKPRPNPEGTAMFTARNAITAASVALICAGATWITLARQDVQPVSYTMSAAINKTCGFGGHPLPVPNATDELIVLVTSQIVKSEPAWKRAAICATMAFQPVEGTD